MKITLRMITCFHVSLQDLVDSFEGISVIFNLLVMYTLYTQINIVSVVFLPEISSQALLYIVICICSKFLKMSRIYIWH